MLQSPLPSQPGMPLSAQAMQALIEAAPDALLIVNGAGQILLGNLQTEVLFGYRGKELLGMSLEALLPERFRQIHVHHRHAFAASPHTRPMGEDLELFGRRKNGEEFPVEISLSPLTQGEESYFMAMVRDVTPRKRLEQALRAAERDAAQRAQLAETHLALLRHMINAMPSAVFLVRGADARLVLANAATAQIWGATWPIGQAMPDFLQEHQILILGMDGRPLLLPDLATIRAVQTRETVHQHQEVIRHPDGTLLPILMHAMPLPADVLHGIDDLPLSDEAEGALVMAQDVTPLKEAERLKDEFIGIAAHELRNPLGALKGFADMLRVQTARGRGPALADWQMEAIEAIDQAADRLTELTDDLLDVTRLQAGRLELHPGRYDLIALVRRVIARQQITTQDHTILLHADPQTLIISIDPLRMEQVLNNLINNAIKYSPDAKVIEVQVQTDATTETVTISVQDQGIGIPTAQHMLLFRRFARADNAQGIGGTGLGLYLCRAIVELHQGHIWFASEEGSGTTFYVTLPLE